MYNLSSLFVYFLCEIAALIFTILHINYEIIFTILSKASGFGCCGRKSVQNS